MLMRLWLNFVSHEHDANQSRESKIYSELFFIPWKDKLPLLSIRISGKMGDFCAKLALSGLSLIGQRDLILFDYDLSLLKSNKKDVVVASTKYYGTGLDTILS